MKCELLIYNVWDIYMNRQKKNYNVEIKFIKFIEHLITILPNIGKQRKMIK